MGGSRGIGEESMAQRGTYASLSSPAMGGDGFRGGAEDQRHNDRLVMFRGQLKKGVRALPVKEWKNLPSFLTGV
jgi:hypothetical protein